MFGTLTIGKRLALGFGITLALAIGIVVYAGLTVRHLSESVDKLANDRMVKVALFADLKSNLQTIARYARNTVINQDAAFVADEKRNIAELRAANTQLLDRLGKVIVLPAGKELLKTLEDNRGPYEAALDRAIEMAQRGETAAAGAFLVGEVRQKQDTVFKAVDDSSQLQQSLAETVAKEALATSATAAALMATLALAMAVIGIGVGWLLTRELRRALGAEPDELAGAASKVAEGDLSTPITVAPDDSASVLASMARMQASLTRVVAEVRANSESVATASAEIAQGNQDLSQRTEEQASALQQTAATTEQLTTTVRHNAEMARQANQLAQGASSVAMQGGEVVGQVVSTMQGISDSSRKIGDIIGVIDGIAFQTNILALNAAVEAARGGRTGTRLCRGGQRGAQPRAAQRRGGQGDQGPDRPQRRAGRARHGAGRPGRQDDGRDRRVDPPRERHRGRDLDRQPGAELGPGTGRRRGRADGPGDAAERGTGRRERSCRGEPQGSGAAAGADGVGVQAVRRGPASAGACPRIHCSRAGRHAPRARPGEECRARRLQAEAAAAGREGRGCAPEDRGRCAEDRHRRLDDVLTRRPPCRGRARPHMERSPAMRGFCVWR
jgi:methyl-accepting chemotaxis protein